MVCLVYSTVDAASLNIATAIKNAMHFDEVERMDGSVHFTSGHADMIEIDSPLCEADFVEALVKTDCFVFLSKHASAKGFWWKAEETRYVLADQDVGCFEGDKRKE